ncbi:MAG TPA: hypothetical protein VG755_01290 [Nannocystaceae bacterium]|nr:hypothetical protein [Nannocystaceae bacterium]
MAIPRLLPHAALVLCALASSCTPAKPSPEIADAAPTAAARDAPADGRPPIELAIDLDALDPGLKREWVEKDLAAITRLASGFPPRTLAEALAAFDAQGNDCAPHSQGLGIEARSCAMPGGYTTCWVALATHDGELFEARAGCRGSETSWSKIAPITERAFAEALVPRGFRVEGRQATTTWVDDAKQQQLRGVLAAKLGALAEIDVPPALQEAVAMLGSPYTRNVLGTACGVGGSPPEAHRAMTALVDAGRDDLLRNALRGVNAGGRVYGYIGLRLLGKNTQADDATYDALRALDLPLEACGGCMTHEQGSATLDLAPFERVHARRTE